MDMRYLKKILIAGIFCCTATLLAQFTLVQDGKPAATIILPRKATRSAQLGALELQYHIKKMTGAVLPIQYEDEYAGKTNRIRIGFDNQGLVGDAGKIDFSGNTLLLTGNDTQDFGKVDYKNWHTFPKVEYECKGSLFAVYDFLENYCGILFCGVEDKDTFYPEKQDLSVEKRNRIFAPSFDAFRDIHSKFNLPARDRALWRLRWRLSSHFGQTNHNQYSIYFAHWGKAKNPNLAKAFKERRPELFSQGSGQFHPADPILRNNYPQDKDLPPQLCYSNQGTINYYAQEVLTYFRGGNVLGGWRNFFGNYPTDRPLLPRIDGKPFFYPIQGGDTGGYCLCNNCTSRFPNNAKNFTNNKFRFIADIANKAAETEPNAGISTLAYGQSLEYPDKVILPSNVAVQLCLSIYSWWHPILREKQQAVYREWNQKEGKKRPLTLWTYMFNQNFDCQRYFGGRKPFPGLYPWKTAEIFKMFAKDGIRGWFAEMELPYNVLEAYVASRLTYDSSLEPTQLIDNYFTACYGKAGDAMKECYREIEQIYWNYAKCPQEWFKDASSVIGSNGKVADYWGFGLCSPEITWKYVTTAHMAKLKDLIAQAQKLVSTPTEKHHLQRFMTCVWNPALTGAREYQLAQQRQTTQSKRLILHRHPQINKDFTKIDWKQATVADKWSDFHGHSVPCFYSVKAIADSDYLYLLFQNGKQDQASLRTVSCFFHAGNPYTVYELTVDPKGASTAWKHQLINGTMTKTPYELKPKIEKGNTPEWYLLCVLPLEKLPLKNNRMHLNFLLESSNGIAIWNPIYTDDCIRGADSFGVLESFPQVIEEDLFFYYRKISAETIADAAATNGYAGAMRAHAGWTLQYKIPKDFIPGKYKISMLIRTDVPAQDGLSITIGTYHPAKRKQTNSKVIPISEISGKHYRKIELGTWNLSPEQYIFIGGLKGKDFASYRIFLDSITFTL